MNRCCGVDEPKNYELNDWLPYSCCLNGKPEQNCTLEMSFKRGCWIAFSDRFYNYRDFNLILEAVMIGAQILVILFSLIFLSDLYKRKNKPSNDLPKPVNV